KPNFIFILADDLGWGDLGCYGNAQIRTPNLDRLAREGTRFTQFYVNSPVCSPSRVAFTTGHFPARHSIHYWLAPKLNRSHGMPDWLDEKAWTVAKLMKQAGYTTAHYGKWHMGEGQGAPEPSAYGFDNYRIICQGNGPKIGTDCADPHGTELLVNETTRFLGQAAARKTPFYINLWPRDVHAALRPTEESLARYKELMSQRRFVTAMQVYYSAITEMDHQLGRLFDKLDETGLSRDTLVVFSSDNGPEDIYVAPAGRQAVGMPGPFRGRKWSLYDGGVRLPFIVHWPGHTPANRVDDTTVVSAVDLLPTFAKLAGAPLPSDLAPDGEDMSAALEGRPQQRSKDLYWEWRFEGVGQYFNRSPMLAIREGKWKLLLNPDRSRVELYDIPADPMELNSQADREPELVRRLAEKALRWQATLPKGPTAQPPGSNAYPWPKPL
ncbi:MAG: sulfatase-like hydrolase/transferase, partial [Acidobacteria bacterium]|nr:sulfatase-like hydrolase/transferase [Acidobacteriota bacterium]